MSVSLSAQVETEDAEEVQYHLCLVGSLPVHPLTTMSMLPWILAEIRKPQPAERDRSTCPGSPGSPMMDQPVVLHITATSVRCVLDMAGPGKPWDPLQHAVLWQHQPHQITKLIHNSQDPSYFCCLARQEARAACYVFHCEDHLKVRRMRREGKGKCIWNSFFFFCRSCVLELQFMNGRNTPQSG